MTYWDATPLINSWGNYAQDVTEEPKTKVKDWQMYDPRAEEVIQKSLIGIFHTKHKINNIATNV